MIYNYTIPHRRMRYHLVLLALTLICSLINLNLLAQSFPAGFSRVQVASGIGNPSAMAFAPDGRIFVAQQNGVIRVIKNGVMLSTPFAQINCDSRGERGLLGITFHPQFASNQYVYIYYTVPGGPNNRLSRITANGDVMAAGSEVTLLNLDPLSSALIHDGGAMRFGKDGKLYLAVGENANPPNSQNLDTYFGKLLRLNPDGSAPSDNPYPSGSEQRKRVWGYGFRNPFTLSIQPGTGRIFVNDVGLSAWEEINDATQGGKNFGWPQAEGNSSNPAYTNPIYTYGHGDGDGVGCAITGGVFFNPITTNYPAQYIGRYFFQDLCNRWINMLDLSGSTPQRIPFVNNIGGDALGLDVGTDGNLYYLERSSSALYKIIYTSNNVPAIVSHPSSITVSEGQPASFSVNATGTAPLTYQWQKNSINIPGANSSTYTIAAVAPGDQAAYRVIISNSAGSATSNEAQLTVSAFNAAPVAKIATPTAGSLYRAGQTITFSGDATDQEDGSLPASAFSWFVDFHHDTHRHDGPAVASGVKSGSFTVPTSGEVSDNVWYRLFLIVTDSKGLKDIDSLDIYPLKSRISINTQPANLQVTVDGQPRNTPFSTQSVEGIQRIIGVVSPQTLNGKTYVFDRWLHGGNATQTISTPIEDVTYTAVYKEGTPSAKNLPGTVEAEDFDTGGEGVAYHDNEPQNKSNAYRNEGVDIENCSEGGYNVDWTVGNEWINYTVNVTTAGSYKIDTRVASAITGAKFHIEFGGINKTGTLNVPNTGSWQNWQTLSSTVSLTAGVQVMRLFIESGNVNFNKFIITSSGGSTAIESGAVYKIIAKHSGKVLDVEGNSTNDGANIWQWEYQGNSNQHWTVELVDGVYYKIIANHSGKAVDVSGVSTADGANVIQWPYWGGQGQQFKFEDAGDGYFKIIARHSGKGLDVLQASLQNGGDVIQWAFLGGENQKWKLEKIQSASARLILDKAMKSALIAYPNPTATEANFRLKLKEVANVSVKVIDSKGNIVYQKKLGKVMDAEGAINLGNVSKGIYIIQCTTSKGESFISRIVKE